MNDVTDLPPPRRLPPGRTAAIRRVLVDEISAPATVARPLWLRPPVWAAAAVAAAGLTAGGLTLFGSVSPAGAWTAVPTSLSSAETARLGQACAQRLAAQHFPLQLGAAHPVLAESRGSFESVLVAGAPDRVAVCVAQSAADTGWKDSGIYRLDPASAPLTVDAVAGPNGGAGAARVAFGRVTPQAVTVLVDTADGRTVTASLAEGRFLAWWPSGAGATRVQALDSSGRTISTVQVPAEPAVVTPTHQ